LQAFTPKDLLVNLAGQLTRAIRIVHTCFSMQVDAEVGKLVGDDDGAIVCNEVGILVGDGVGTEVGAVVGSEVGKLVGDGVGTNVDAEVGTSVGDDV